MELTEARQRRWEGLEPRLYSMNALEILRETIRILRFNSAGFAAIAGAFLWPFSALVLSGALVPAPAVRSLYGCLWLLARSSGLAATPAAQSACLRISEMLVSATLSLPISATLSLLAKSAIAHCVASSYAAHKLSLHAFLSALPRFWRRALLTHLSSSLVVLACLALFLSALLSLCSALSALGLPPSALNYPAFLLLLLFAIAFAHATVISNLACVISVLEDVSGPRALLRSLILVKDQTHVGLLIFLGSTIGMAFVEGLFQHRVKALAYGDASSRFWEAPLLVLMYSFVILIDSMMSAVFYFTCRSSSAIASLDADAHPISHAVSTAFASRSSIS